MHPTNNNIQQQQQINNFCNNHNEWCSSSSSSNNGINNSNSMQVQQQHEHQHQQHGTSDWNTADVNKIQRQQQQQKYLLNNNNNSSNINSNNNYNLNLLHRQSTQQNLQQQQNYAQHYNNYPQQVSAAMDCYYTQSQQQHGAHTQIETSIHQQVHAPSTAYASIAGASSANVPQSPQPQQLFHRHTHSSQLHNQQQQLQVQARTQAQAHTLISHLVHHQLVSLDGMQTGVPTLTTPTLTPTTLRSIEESLEQLTSEPSNAPYQAGFKPPPLAPLANVISNNNNPTLATAALSGYNAASAVTLQSSNAACLTDSEDSQSSLKGYINDDDDNTTTDTSSAATDSTSYQNGLSNVLGNAAIATSNGVANDFTSVFAKQRSMNSSNTTANTSNNATIPAPTRRGGGRRPTKPSNMTPEEEEKRRIRRERNKLAAARCRKRRVDQTNELMAEVQILENKREILKQEIEALSTSKVHLEYVLDEHRPKCQKLRGDLLSANGIIAPAVSNSNSNDSSSATITGLDPTLTSTGRSNSPIDLKPELIDDHLLQIKHEPLDNGLDSSSSLDQDGPPSPKRIMVSNNIPLPNMSTLTASLTTPTGPVTASLNTPIMPMPPVSFGVYNISNSTGAPNIMLGSNPALNALNKTNKQRPNTLPVGSRSFAQSLQLSVDGKTATEIQGVPIQTPSTGVFNFESLMEGGTGLTPVSGPLQPTCSSQNKNPLEMPTPTSEPSKLVSL